MKDMQQAYRSDNDVNVLALFHEESHLSLDELLGHLLGISSPAVTRLLDIDFQELSTERLNLFTRRRARVESAYDSSKATRSSDCTQTSDASADNEYFAWRYLCR